MKREILLLGNPKLYEVSQAVEGEELPEMASVVCKLHDTLPAFRRKYHAGRYKKCRIRYRDMNWKEQEAERVWYIV